MSHTAAQPTSSSPATEALKVLQEHLPDVTVANMKHLIRTGHYTANQVLQAAQELEIPDAERKTVEAWIGQVL